MRKVWTFEVKGYQVKVVNSWFHGAKMYVNGDLKDFDKSIFVLNNETLMSASLGEHGVLEVIPKPQILSVALDAYLVKNDSKELVYSSKSSFKLKAI